MFLLVCAQAFESPTKNAIPVRLAISSPYFDQPTNVGSRLPKKGEPDDNAFRLIVTF